MTRENEDCVLALKVLVRGDEDRLEAEIFGAECEPPDQGHTTICETAFCAVARQAMMMSPLGMEGQLERLHKLLDESLSSMKFGGAVDVDWDGVP